MNAKASRAGFEMESNGNPAMVAFETWMNIQRPMISAMTEINGKIFEQAARANNEWLGFLSRRFNEDMATSQRLMECRTMQDVFAAYSDFLNRAQQQYQAEFQYFTRLNQKIADETASVVKSSLEEANAELRH
jgi:glutathione S-transferase